MWEPSFENSVDPKHRDGLVLWKNYQIIGPRKSQPIGCLGRTDLEGDLGRFTWKEIGAGGEGLMTGNSRGMAKGRSQ